MTTSRATSAKESLPIGTPSSPGSGRPVLVFSQTLDVAAPLPVRDSVPLDSVLKEFESDPVMAGYMAEARQDLARSLYADEPNTLSTLRLAAGLSQAELARRIGTSQPHIARIESGLNDPTTDVVVRIAVGLGVDHVTAFNAIREKRGTTA
jgi:DNA-binding XRE family transcriptional regulator